MSSYTFKKSSMMTNPIILEESGKKEKVVEPKMKCRTCDNCTGSYCNILKRHIDKNYNRCWNHTMYVTPAITIK